MKFFKIVGMIVCFLLIVGCSKKELGVDSYADVVQVDQPIGSTYSNSETSEDDIFSEIRFRVLDGERVDSCCLLWPVEGDTLANIVWAVHGKGSNVARIMRIVEINGNINDPNLIHCDETIKIPVE